jgi:hypothetical protein
MKHLNSLKQKIVALIIISGSLLAKNWRLCTKLAAGACKVCCRVSNGLLSFASIWRQLLKIFFV